MKKNMLTMAAVAILGAGALQAGDTNNATSKADQAKNKSTTQTAKGNKDCGLCPASSITGKNVQDKQGNNLGHVEKLLVDPASGRVRYAVIEVDKTWEWNDPQVAVPFQALEMKSESDGDETVVTLDATKEKLEKAPKFKDEDADRLYSKEASAPIYSYWTIMWYDDPAMSNDAAKKSSDSSKTEKQDKKSS